MQQPPSSLSFGETSQFYIEYMKRSEPYNMTSEHYHSYYEIYYLLSGKRVYFIRDRSYSVEAGDLVFINKHDVHKTMQLGDPSHERLIIHANDHWIRKWYGEHAELLLSPFQQTCPVLRLPHREQVDIQTSARTLLKELRGKEPGFDLMARQACIDIMLISARYLLHHEPTPFTHVSPLHAKISDIVHHINGHFREPIRLNELAERFFISPYYLSRMFKEVTGFSFSDYITLTRVKEAQRLLSETTLSITEIAGQVGFDNFSHFGKTFKRVTSMSPRHYRNNMS
ncbi:AraC family transcriptional regulator [Paenibacillus sp. HB172176]|uniref:helix-turn-helix domain-containing protein n=1 Tax=Paenibacillus sp. HB172176 TaxID=2493690 RepID=UPI001439B196|nr:AraC family transcriptional regulator [Paenibacillus sp. HB172176]